MSATGLLLLNMGGPDSLGTVRPFLFNLFSDPDIIRLPFSWLMQKPLAWWIAIRRYEEAQKNYAMMGGASPILKWTEAQGAALQARLAERGFGELPVFVAMRYWHPFTEEAVSRIQAYGVDRLIVLPLYPHFSYTTTGSSLNALRQVLDRRGISLPMSVIPAFYDHAGYQQAVAQTIRTALEAHDWTCPVSEVRILFSAHSLPLKHVKRTRDPYPEQIRATAERIMQNYFPSHPWDLAYQSQVGNMPWLGPSTDGVLHYYAGHREDNILIVAISFVSDHVETLVEIDRLYLPMAAELGITRCYRAPALNTEPRFIEALADLVEARLREPESARAVIPDFKELLAAG